MNEQDVLAFLAKVLPSRGFYHGAPRKNGHFLGGLGGGLESAFFTKEQSVLYSRICDQDTLGLDTFFAIASFRIDRFDPRNTPQPQRLYGRTHKNVALLRCFPGDVDVGEGKPYASRDEALAALAGFVDETGLPFPIVNSSGSGLHCYWPLSEDVEPSVWRPIAFGLKTLMMQRGFYADPARTADMSTVLRMPGTYNRKPGRMIARVEIIENADAEPEDLGKFEHLAELCPPSVVDRAAMSTVALRCVGGLDMLRTPSSLARAAQECAQLARWRESRGDIDEPALMALIGVAKDCTDGRELAHEWSKGERYDAAYVEARLNKPGFGGTTCAKIDEVSDNKLCNACEHFKLKTSPIVFGREEEREVVEEGDQPSPEDPNPFIEDWQLDNKGRIKSNNLHNAEQAVKMLRLDCKFEEFRQRYLVNGARYDDRMLRELNYKIMTSQRSYGMDCGDQLPRAIKRNCEANSFDDMQNQMRRLKEMWDGKPRLDRWPISYMAAPDNRFTRVAGRKIMMASVARILRPGCRFDNMLILVGAQGRGKSKLLRIWADGTVEYDPPSDSVFCDQPLLHLDTKRQLEIMKGKWIMEIAELVGMNKTTWEELKAFMSRHSEESRQAYDRETTFLERRQIFVATTNEFNFLGDVTGNRRFWPIVCASLTPAQERNQLLQFERDRNQILAEACVAVDSGEPLELPDTVYHEAAEAAEAHRSRDPWEIVLMPVVASGAPLTVENLLFQVLRCEISTATQKQTRMLINAMRALGYKPAIIVTSKGHEDGFVKI